MQLIKQASDSVESTVNFDVTFHDALLNRVVNHDAGADLSRGVGLDYWAVLWCNRPHRTFLMQVALSVYDTACCLLEGAVRRYRQDS